MFNDPFHFAVPDGESIEKAASHVAREFGVRGTLTVRLEVPQRDPWTLCSITNDGAQTIAPEVRHTRRALTGKVAALMAAADREAE